MPASKFTLSVPRSGPGKSAAYRVVRLHQFRSALRTAKDVGNARYDAVHRCRAGTPGRVFSLAHEPQPSLELGWEAEPVGRLSTRALRLAENTSYVSGSDTPQTPEDVPPPPPSPAAVDAEVFNALLQVSHEKLVHDFEWEKTISLSNANGNRFIICVSQAGVTCPSLASSACSIELCAPNLSEVPPPESGCGGSPRRSVGL